MVIFMDKNKDKNKIDILVDEKDNLIIDFNFIEVCLDIPEIDTPDLIVED